MSFNYHRTIQQHHFPLIAIPCYLNKLFPSHYSIKSYRQNPSLFFVFIIIWCRFSSFRSYGHCATAKSISFVELYGIRYTVAFINIAHAAFQTRSDKYDTVDIYAKNYHPQRRRDSSENTIRDASLGFFFTSRWIWASLLHFYRIIIGVRCSNVYTILCIQMKSCTDASW